MSMYKYQIRVEFVLFSKSEREQKERLTEMINTFQLTTLESVKKKKKF